MAATACSSLSLPSPQLKSSVAVFLTGQYSVKIKLSLRSQISWIQFLAPPFVGCVTVEKLLSLPVPHFPYITIEIRKLPSLESCEY